LGHALPECRAVDPPPNAPLHPPTASDAATEDTFTPGLHSVTPLCVIPCLHASQAPLVSVRWLPQPPSAQGVGGHLLAALGPAGEPRWKLLPVELRALPTSTISLPQKGAFVAALAAETPADRKAAGWSHRYDGSGRLCWTPPPVPDDADLFDRYFSAPAPQEASTAPFLELLGQQPEKHGGSTGAAASWGDELFLLAAVPVAPKTVVVSGSSCAPASAAEDGVIWTAVASAGLHLGCVLVTSSSGSFHIPLPTAQPPL
jgi:hypothetical protein